MPFPVVLRSFTVLLAAPFLVTFQAPPGAPQATQCFVKVDTAATGGVSSIQYLKAAVPHMVHAPGAGSFTWPVAAVGADAAHARDNSPLVTAVPTLAGYRSYYIGADNKLNYVSFQNKSWSHTEVAPAVVSNDVSCLAAGSFQPDPKTQQSNLFYISPGNYVSIIGEAGDHWTDPTELSFGETPRTGTPLVTANLSANNETHVFYIGDDNLVHEYFLRNKEWANGIVNVKAKPCRNPSALVAINNSSGYHLYYFGEDNRLISLTFAANKWDTASVNNAMRASVTSTIGIDAATGNLVYEDAEYNLHVLQLTKDGWQDSKLTLPTQFDPDYGSPLALSNGYVFFKFHGAVIEVKLVKG